MSASWTSPRRRRGDGGRRRPPTLADELRLALADDIVRGLITPGAALDETELARRFGVSRTPVREAIRQLDASGLIEVRAHRGAVVARPSEERLLGMFEAMAELEALCAGLAAERMTAPERRARGRARGAARAHPRRRPAALPRGQRGVPRHHLCRRAQFLSRRDDACHTPAGAAVPPRPVPQSRPAGPVAPGARPRGGRDPAWRPRGRR